MFVTAVVAAFAAVTLATAAAGIILITTINGVVGVLSTRNFLGLVKRCGTITVRICRGPWWARNSDRVYLMQQQDGNRLSNQGARAIKIPLQECSMTLVTKAQQLCFLSGVAHIKVPMFLDLLGKQARLGTLWKLAEKEHRPFASLRLDAANRATGKICVSRTTSGIDLVRFLRALSLHATRSLYQCWRHGVPECHGTVPWGSLLLNMHVLHKLHGSICYNTSLVSRAI